MRPIDLLLPCNGAFGSGTEAKGANLSQDTEARVSASHRFALGLMNLWQTRTRIMVAVGLNTSNHLTGIVRRIARHCRVSAPTNLSSCFSLSFVLFMSYLCLNSVLFTSYIRRDVSRGALFNSSFY